MDCLSLHVASTGKVRDEEAVTLINMNVRYDETEHRSVIFSAMLEIDPTKSD